MVERPILFAGEIVRALLAGKTQMRRIVKSKDGEMPPAEAVQVKQVGPWFHLENTRQSAAERDQFGPRLKMWTYTSPYGQPGDRLWVRETFQQLQTWQENGETFTDVGKQYFEYAATNEMKWQGLWRPSIHMPREASRLLLEITAVRCERVQHISESEARAEGCQLREFSLLFMDSAERKREYADAYGNLWVRYNSPDSWAANCWVWVIEFKRVQEGGQPNG